MEVRAEGCEKQNMGSMAQWKSGETITELGGKERGVDINVEGMEAMAW